MIIVGLDLSLTSAGIAILRDGEPVLIKSVGHTGKDGASYQQRSRRVRSQCGAILGVLWTWSGPNGGGRDGIRDDIDLAVIEGPSYGSQYGDAFDRAALWHGVFGALEAKRVPIAVIAPPTLKLWFTGNGGTAKGAERGEAKRRMLDTARARYRPAISTTDEADAIALASAGAFRLGDSIPWQPNQRQLDSLEKIEWPVMV